MSENSFEEYGVADKDALVSRIRMRRLLHVSFLLISAIITCIIAYVVLLSQGKIPGTEQWKLKEFKGNTHEIRNALEQFQADTGAYPTRLADLVTSVAATTGIDLTGKVVPISPGSYNGPYLSTTGGIDGSRIPVNPYGPPLIGKAGADIDAHWEYSRGIVHGVNDPTRPPTQPEGIPCDSL